MRRSDREVRDREAIEAFLSSTKTVRIAFSTDSAPYIVPLSFGYEWRGELPVLYFHSAHEGRKVSLMRADASVGFEIDELLDVHGGSEGCSWTASYFSIIGSGRLEEVEDAEEKMKALHMILRHQSGRDFPIPESALGSVLVMKLSVLEMSAKSNKG